MTWLDAWSFAKEAGSLLGAGVVGGLLTAHFQWGIEKKKQILLRRRELGNRLEVDPHSDDRSGAGHTGSMGRRAATRRNVISLLREPKTASFG